MLSKKVESMEEEYGQGILKQCSIKDAQDWERTYMK